MTSTLANNKPYLSSLTSIANKATNRTTFLKQKQQTQTTSTRSNVRQTKATSPRKALHPNKNKVTRTVRAVRLEHEMLKNTVFLEFFTSGNWHQVRRNFFLFKGTHYACSARRKMFYDSKAWNAITFFYGKRNFIHKTTPSFVCNQQRTRLDPPPPPPPTLTHHPCNFIHKTTPSFVCNQQRT